MNLVKHNVMRELVVLLQDILLDENLEFNDGTVIVNDERKKKFTCYICMAKFSTALNMNKHKALHDDSELEDDDEDQTFALKKVVSPKPKPPSINTTPRIETVDAPKDKTECNETLTPETQKIHLNTPFKCDTCDVFFQNSDDAKLHNKSKNCKFSCRTCNRKFNTLYAFVVHVVQHRSDAVKSNNPRVTLNCSICKESFENSLLLRSHELNSHAPKPNSPPPTSGSVATTIDTNIDASSITTTNITTANVTTTNVTTVAYNNSTTTVTTSVDSNLSIKEEPVETPAPNEPDANQLIELCCELCYDVFNSEEQFKSHMEFHEQLENKCDTIVIEDDDDEVVEVFEDKKDPHEIITTIKSKPKTKKKIVQPETTKSVPKLQMKQILQPVDQAWLERYTKLPAVQPKPVQNNISNQALTDSIKDMLTPRSEKQARSVLLPKAAAEKSTPVFRPTRGNVLQKTAENNSKTVDSLPTLPPNLQLCKTGPYSFALKYAAAASSSGVNSGAASAQSTPNASLTNAVSALPNPVISYTNTSQAIAQQGIVTPPSNVATSNATNGSNVQLIINVPYLPGLENNATSTVTTTTATTTTVTTGNITPNSSSQMPTIPAAGSVSSSFSYVVNPSLNIPSPIVLNDPQKKLAYVIIPHGNNTAVSPSGGTAMVTTSRLQPVPNVSQQTVGQTTQSSNAAASTVHTIPNVLSTITIASTVASSSPALPVTATVNDRVQNGPSTPSVNVVAPLASTSYSLPPRPGPSKEPDAVIVIDSDSDEPAAVDDVKNESDAESGNLVIDESSPTIEQESPDKLPDPIDESDNTDQISKKQYKFPMKCEGCCVIFHRMRGMRQHNERKHRCQLCNFRCCKVMDFKQHYILEHRKFYCARCAYLSDSKRQFTKHNREKHICMTCNGFFFNVAIHECAKPTDKGPDKDKDDEQSQQGQSS